jgi:hypothetical protein
MYRRINSTEALIINDLRNPSNKFDDTFDPQYSSVIIHNSSLDVMQKYFL